MSGWRPGKWKSGRQAGAGKGWEPRRLLGAGGRSPGCVEVRRLHHGGQCDALVPLDWPCLQDLAAES